MLFFVFAPYFGSFRLFFQLFSSLNVFKNNQKKFKISSQISKKSNDRFGLKAIQIFQAYNKGLLSQKRGASLYFLYLNSLFILFYPLPLLKPHQP